VANSARKEATFIEIARRQQILDVALEMFADKGFHQTSLAEISSVLEISKGVISYHFNGKSDLGQEVIRHIIRKLSKAVQKRVAAKGTGKEKLLEFVSACIDYIDDNRSDYLTYMDTMGCFGTMEEKREMIAWANRNTRAVIVSLIKEGQADGSIGPVNARNSADVLQSIVDGLMEATAAEPDVIHLKGCKRIVKKMIVCLIAPKTK
jgi:AcrR family transcriptional regulator